MENCFKTQIKDIQEVTEIANLLKNSTKLKSNIDKHADSPIDTKFKKCRCQIPLNFQKKGDTIYLVGEYRTKQNDTSSIIEVLFEAIEKGLMSSACSIKPNTLFEALVEASAINKLGFDITSDAEMEEKEFLFKDNNSAFIVSVNTEQEEYLVDFMYKNGVQLTLLGHVTKGELRMDEISFGYISEYYT